MHKYITFTESAPCAARMVLAALAVIAVMPGIASAATPDAYCSSIITNTGVLSAAAGSGPGVGPFNSLIITSLLILLVMINVSAICYLVGYTFRLDRLLRFGQAELGEVAITVLVVLVFIGSLQAVTFNGAFSLPPGNFLAVAPGVSSPNIFLQDCTSMSSSINVVIADLSVLLVYQELDIFFSSVSFGTTIADGNIGFSNISPLQGLTLQSMMMGSLFNVAFDLIGLPLATTFVLGIVFSLFPLFLYAGIIMRSIPWTRAAGGAFLGLFIAFYLMFPLMLYMLLSTLSTVALQSPGTGTIQNFLSAFSPTNLFAPGHNLLGFDEVGVFMALVIPNMFYVLFSIVLSFIVSYDFMEAVGDLLGAPSLKASDALKKII